MCWPRTPDVPWYDNYIVLLGTAIVVAVGLIYMLLARPYRHSSAPESDAIAIAERIRASRPEPGGAPITAAGRS